MIISRTPLRICLSGGGTDLPSYYEKYGGHVLSMAINKYIYITYKPDYFEKLLKVRYSQIEIVTNAKDLQNHRARQALIDHGIFDSCEINSCADLPSNTGLGSSGSFLVGLLHCIREYQRLDKQPVVLAEEACKIEIEELKEPVGKQDQYIAAYGGIQRIEIGQTGYTNVSPVTINEGDLPIFLSKMCVYYLNIKRDASDILSEQQKLKGNTEELLHKIKEHVPLTLKLLKDGNFDDYGRLLDEYWMLKKQLSDKISVPIVEDLYKYVKTEFGVLGGKLIGAGGGGFLLLYCPSNQYYLDIFMKSRGFNRLHYNIDNHGSMILGNFTN